MTSTTALRGIHTLSPTRRAPEGARRAPQVRDFALPQHHVLRAEVGPSMPTGPRAWNLSVLMPISAPRPILETIGEACAALTMTLAESTSRRKRRGSITCRGDDRVGVVRSSSG